MTRTARITINAETVSPSRVIAAAARGAPLLVVTHRAFRDLADELGGDEQAARHLCRVATNTGRPIAANLPTGLGGGCPNRWPWPALAGVRRSPVGTAPTSKTSRSRWWGWMSASSG